MTRILVRPDDLVDLAGQLRRSGEALVGILQGANGAYQRMDTEVRALSDVASGLYTLERLMLVQGPALERLVRYLERQAEGFREADGAQDPLPAAPLPVGMPLESSPLSLAPPIRPAMPRWIFYTSASLKVVAGGLAVWDGIKMMGTATTPLGLVMVPAGVVAILHGLGDSFEGIHELLTGEDQENFTKQLYQDFLGEEQGSKVFKRVDSALTVINGVRGLAKKGDRFLLKLAGTGKELSVDVANKIELPKLIYEHVWG